MYEKQTWNTGDVITEGKLNHIEDGISTGGGIYSINEVALFDGEVTTVYDEDSGYSIGQFEAEDELPAQDLKVVFNGTEYILPYISSLMGSQYGELEAGDPSFANYPLFIFAQGGSTYSLSTETAGTYHLNIKNSQMNVSEEFKNNVPYIVKVNSPEEGTFVMDKTLEELMGLINKNVIIYNVENENREYLISADAANGVYTLGISGGNPISYLYRASDIEDHPSRTEQN